MKTYQVTARRAGSWWALHVPALKGVHTQVRRLDQAEAMARDAIALFLNVRPNTFAVEVAPAVPAQVSRALKARKAAAAAGQRADELTSAAARDLVRSGVSVRDAGALLGLSPQRISQLTREHTPA